MLMALESCGSVVPAREGSNSVADSKGGGTCVSVVAGVEGGDARVSGAASPADGSSVGRCDADDGGAECWCAEADEASVLFVARSCCVLNITAGC